MRYYLLSYYGDEGEYSDETTIYRKGYEPGGYILDYPATSVSVGNLYTGNFSNDTPQVFKVSVTTGESYKVMWEDDEDHGSTTYTGSIYTYAYPGSQSTPYFEEESGGYTDPQDITAVDDTLYIIVYTFEDDMMGSFSLKVEEL
ncbi:hypothetical protein [Sediminispirochaeta bajacaliforniensis]|uniref:hypothetical protein n=1 Tax=Sediminispirochaeta bajacaliforniensis TaxID=148 RepID=UPI000368147D|nr:hypothetical protein [Sediminispirochaeta bajacaliforniensis]